MKSRMSVRNSGMSLVSMLLGTAVSSVVFLGAGSISMMSGATQVRATQSASFQESVSHVRQALRDQSRCTQFLGDTLPGVSVLNVVLQPGGVLDPAEATLRFPVRHVKANERALVTEQTVLHGELRWASAGVESGTLRLHHFHQRGAPAQFGILDAAARLENERIAASNWYMDLELVARSGTKTSAAKVSLPLLMRAEAQVSIDSNGQEQVSGYQLEFVSCKGDGLSEQSVASGTLDSRRVCELQGGEWVEQIFSENGQAHTRPQCVLKHLAVTDQTGYRETVRERFGPQWQEALEEEGSAYVSRDMVLRKGLAMRDVDVDVVSLNRTPTSSSWDGLVMRASTSSNLNSLRFKDGIHWFPASLSDAALMGCPSGQVISGIGAQGIICRNLPPPPNGASIQVQPACPAGQFVKSISAPGGLVLNQSCVHSGVTPGAPSGVPNVMCENDGEALRGVSGNTPICESIGMQAFTAFVQGSGTTGMVSHQFEVAPDYVIINLDHDAGSPSYNASTWVIHQGNSVGQVSNTEGSTLSLPRLNGNRLEFSWTVSRGNPGFSLIAITD